MNTLRKMGGLLTCLALLGGLLTVSAAAAVSPGVYTGTVTTSYYNPDTGNVDDGGTANAALGEGMCRSATDTTGLVEVDSDGNIWLTIRLLLQSSCKNVALYTRTGNDSYSAISYTIMAEDSGNDSIDYRFKVTDAEVKLKGTMYVTPMGRDVMWYLWVDTSTLKAGSGDFVASVNTTPVAVSFSDVPSGYWAKSYIDQAVSAGLFNGTSATTFSPDGQMTCDMVIAVLYRMAGSPAVTVPGNLANIPSGAWYESAAAWGYANGVIGGYKTFNPAANVTREELATMLYRYHALNNTPVAGANLSSFTDNTAVSTWARTGVAWANAAGVVSGTSATTLSPANSATRAQVATMLCRYLNTVK